MKAVFNINEWIINTLGISSGLWILIAAVLFALLCLFFVLSVRNGRMKARQMFIETGWTALWYFGIILLSLLTYWPFKGSPLLTPGNPMPVWLAAAAVIIVLYILYFRKRKKHFADLVSATAIRKSAAGSGASKFCYALLFAGMLVSAVVTGIRAVGGDSFIHLVVPMFTVVLVLLLNSLTRWRIWFLLGGIALLAYAFLMIQNVLATDGFGYTPLLAMIPLFLSAILPMLSLAFIRH